jgi:cytochrome c-type biogenesis protein CcmE
MKPRSRRFLWIAGGVVGLALVMGLVLNAFRSNLVFFFTPSQIEAGEAPLNHNFRVGGMVKTGSLTREGTHITFEVSDSVKTVKVDYTGIPPDLFKEGKGVVAEGQLGPDKVFHAYQILAKHDENYMPPEAAEAMKKAAAGETAAMTKSIVTPTGQR